MLTAIKCCIHPFIDRSIRGNYSSLGEEKDTELYREEYNRDRCQKVNVKAKEW